MSVDLLRVAVLQGCVRSVEFATVLTLIANTNGF